MRVIPQGGPQKRVGPRQVPRLPPHKHTTAYSNVYQIMQCLPRNASVRSHQVNHFVRTFDALFGSNLYVFDQWCVSSNFFWWFQRSDAFYKPSFSSTNLNPCMTVTNCSSCWWVVSGFVLLHLCLCVVTNTFLALRGASWFLHFLILPPITPCMLTMYASQMRKQVFYKISTISTVKSCFQFSENTGLPASR